MKGGLAVTLLALSTVSCLCVLVVFYVAFGLATAQVIALVPFVGPQVSPRVEAWVLGAEEPLEIDEAPLPPGGIELTPLPTFELPDVTPSPLCETEEARRPRISPLNGSCIVTQGFHPGHSGIDLSSGRCDTAVVATHCGVVAHAGWSEVGYGNLVMVTQGDFTTYYAHLSSISVSVGDQVEQGRTVGQVGSTGHSTGCHLHYEVRVKGVAQNPA
jgi:murein DD-endopeptidase MepM/ murein hydrolase activator NlpD